MARTNGTSLDSIDEVEDQLKDVIQGLYQVMVQVAHYDNAGTANSKEVVASELKSLSSTLQNIHNTAAAPSTRLPHVPVELIAYVENGRNPDIYTREFVEMLRRGNQLMRGKTHAFESFRDILAEEMRAAMPEVREDVDRVVAATTAPSGGSKSGTASSAATTARDNNGSNSNSAPATAQFAATRQT
ncbi:hypothetical protein MCOR27_011412 [Pyricularia oryzae]|uniref:Mediator of RNA polymerase II transcription subunit 10 n=5 Tax=Pyricularia TaxID=48558 RepID=A0ABQ8N2U1_PYRGI|nr:uncharacterized protein MGG_05314 [Pyricularia oryzae 70-15]ELQ44962.1 mediator of RNA polymerase II transcription subunit 10 [Pyricularia oryzae Y34]KAH8848257.1 hypothetical protein MCOR01_001638 [Pyricularia oryzae]KAI6290307.1 hypothetical protein MCOR33_011386 [Pyricularia grisea]EHA53068.1 hypothetical protein MGG_05314 [Pyricularia oryzae 70-15]KAH9429802.1 hypothetical protein MCOR02_009536 [Pyricularia oryzae]